MKHIDNVLIVDDEKAWRKFYEDELREVGVARVRAAANLLEAGTVIDAMCFAVALVDIGLVTDDDRNTDGLRVMEKIRDVGDRTSIIVITGRSGPDMLSVVRDAMKKFDAYDAVAKTALRPAQLRDLVRGGIRAYEQVGPDARQSLYAALRGDVPQVLWDDQMMRIGVADGGVAALYRMVEHMFAPFVPLLAGAAMSTSEDAGVAHGIFWSRGAGQAIIACLGEADRIRQIKDGAQAAGVLLGKYRITEVLAEYTHGSVGGVVCALADRERNSFG